MNYWRRAEMRKYDRPEVKQITKEWVVQNCMNVTDRDLGLLKLLGSRRLLRRDQVQRLYPEFPSSDYLNKRLSILFRKHLIDRVYPQVPVGMGSSQQHICLDRAGISLLGLENYTKVIRPDDIGNRSLPLGWRHIIKINDYECDIRELEGVEVLEYDIENPLPYNDTRLIPDIFCFLKSGGRGYLFFIEVDLGTEN